MRAAPAVRIFVCTSSRNQSRLLTISLHFVCEMLSTLDSASLVSLSLVFDYLHSEIYYVQN